MREKSRPVKPEVVVYFGLLFGQIWIRGRWVRKTGHRHISTSSLAFRALFWPVLSRNRTSTARKAFYKKTGCTRSKSVAQEYNSETGNTFKSARNGPKSREIDRNSKKNVMVKPQVDLQNRK